MFVSERLPHAPIIKGPKNQTVVVGETAVFNCRILLSDLHPHIQWLRHYTVNGSYTTPEGDPYVNVLQVWALIELIAKNKRYSFIISNILLYIVSSFVELYRSKNLDVVQEDVETEVK